MEAASKLSSIERLTKQELAQVYFDASNSKDDSMVMVSGEAILLIQERDLLAKQLDSARESADTIDHIIDSIARQKTRLYEMLVEMGVSKDALKIELDKARKGDEDE